MRDLWFILKWTLTVFVVALVIIGFTVGVVGPLSTYGETWQ